MVFCKTEERYDFQDLYFERRHVFSFLKKFLNFIYIDHFFKFFGGENKKPKKNIVCFTS